MRKVAELGPIFLELALALALLIAAGWRLRAAGWNSSDRADGSRTVDVFGKGVFAIGDFGGLDQTGAPVPTRITAQTERVALFVVGPEASSTDCGYWKTVSAEIDNEKPSLRLVGYCRGECCKASPGFPMVAFAEQAVMDKVALLDQLGQVLLTDSRGRAVASFRWRGLLADDTARRLLALSNAH